MPTYVIMGATGHVGGATARTLIEAGEDVIALTREEKNAADLKDRGAKIVIADVEKPDKLREAFRLGDRAFLLNPPADPATDTDKEERGSVANILSSLEGSDLEMVVAESTYGARAGERIGDLSILYEFEKGLKAQPIPATILRAAYYMSNWDMMLDLVRESGVLTTMFPADLKIPMVAPDDLGRNASKLLRGSGGSTVYVEGPESYSAEDVAAAFAKALDRDVRVEVTARDGWISAFRELGFSPEAADSYARMTATVVDGDFEVPENPVRGTITLDEYISDLVRRDNEK